MHACMLRSVGVAVVVMHACVVVVEVVGDMVVVEVVEVVEVVRVVTVGVTTIRGDCCCCRACGRTALKWLV